MKSIPLVISLLLLFCSVNENHCQQPYDEAAAVEYYSSAEPFASSKRSAKQKIQVAILLDTSNSMDGLIDQAKSQLWKMVNELTLMRDKDGQLPDIELALFEYGNDNLSGREGHIRLVSPLSTDLDLISEKLFSLSTNGGQEYCGHVIQSATKQLNWTKSFDDLKIIFIAGNEGFNQGTVDFNKSCKAAIAEGIIINTIFCGGHSEGIRGQWKAGSDLADGKYINIDQNETVLHIDSPQDKEINELNKKLNDTYIGYGYNGNAMKSRQMEQDDNASSFGRANTSQRVKSKASSAYKNESWDIVDAVAEESVELSEMEPEDLPEEMKDMDDEEKVAFVNEKSEERKRVQSEINRLDAERTKYVAEERARMSSDGSATTLDEAIIKTIREQASCKELSVQE
ncbi:hypothetical protein N8482_01395 [Chitinophagales bacterium]|nr:hypothetical protein [Chitinophagales bacterium]